MVLRTTREHVDLATTARVSVLDPHRRPLRRIRRAVPLLQLPSVALRQRRAHVALVLHRARQDRRARAARRAGLLLALRDHDLVLDVVVHHVHLVLVRLLGVLRVRGQREHDAWAAPERRLRLVVDADAREVHALLVDRGPALHEVSGDLRNHAGQQLWAGSTRRRSGWAHLHQPDFAQSGVHHERLVRVGLVVVVVPAVHGIKLLAILIHGCGFHCERRVNEDLNEFCLYYAQLDGEQGD